MHTWLATQTEGWWRYGFDDAGVPYDYISTQTVAKEDDLRAKYDVIVFAPVSRASARDIIDGMPTWHNAMPWQKTGLTPNLGRIDSTDDIRPGLGYEGLAHLKKFVEQGGLLITCEDTAQFAIDAGLAPGVSTAPVGDARVAGSVLNTVFVGARKPRGQRIRPEPAGDERQRNGLQHQQHAGPIGWPCADGSLRGATHRPRHAGRQRRAAGPEGRRSRAAPEAAAMGSAQAE